MSFRSFGSSNNPAFRETLIRQRADEATAAGYNTMTVKGAINKTFILTAILIATAIWAYGITNPIIVWGSAIAGLIAVIVATFKTEWSPIIAPVYAAFEGIFVGSITAMYAAQFTGIVFNALSLTVAILFAMLFIYRSGLIVVTQKFRMAVVMATFGVLAVYLVTWLLSFFGIRLPFIHEGGTIGIIISLVIIGIASMNLLLDFDNFEKGEEYGAPDYMEWYFGMGLLITLVWIYIELLRLLARFSSRD